MSCLSQKISFAVIFLVLAFASGPLSFYATGHLLTGAAQRNMPRAVMLGNPQEKPPVPPHCTICPPAAPRGIYAPAIELKEAGECEIVLNSRSRHPIDVTPILYSVEGEQIIGNPVQLQPAEIRFIPIQTLIPEKHKAKRRWGTCATESGRTGRLVFSAYRAINNDSNPKIIVKVGGSNQNGQNVDAQGTINLTCSQ